MIYQISHIIRTQYVFLSSWLRHIFTHKWKETAHDGPFTFYHCTGCDRTKISSHVSRKL
jgi:hypothetical protein